MRAIVFCCLILASCGGDAFTAGPARPALVPVDGGDDAAGPSADAPSAEDGGGDAPSEAPADAGAPDRDADGHDAGGPEDAPEEPQDASADGGCTPMSPTVMTIDAGCTIDAPSRFGAIFSGGCAAPFTPPECQCIGLYTCACLSAHALGTVYDPCAANHWGVWTGCTEDNGVPVVTCQ